MQNLNPGYEPLLLNENVPMDDDASAWFSRAVPPELMKLIVDEMPIDSVTALASSDRATWKAYTARNGVLPYETICSIRTAVQSDGDTAKTLAALCEIDKEPLTSKPQLMRGLAEKVAGFAKTPFGDNLPEWDLMVKRVESALIDHFGPDCRGPQWRDLCLAKVHAQFLPPMGDHTSWLQALLQRDMREFPADMRGDFVAAANALDIPLLLDDWRTFLLNVTVRSRPVSDKFACSIGLKLLEIPEIYDPVHCLEKCGITKTQIERIILPSCAADLLRDMAFGQTTIKTKCERWGIYADTLAAEVQARICLKYLSDVKRYDSAMAIFSIDMDPPRVKDNVTAFVRKLECDTILALGKDQTHIDNFLVNWQFASTAVDAVDEWIGKFERLTTDNIPVVCRPALLDRWALSLKTQTGQIDEIEAKAGHVYAWLNSAMTLPALQCHPKLLGRMGAALVNALDARSTSLSREIVATQRTLLTDLFVKLPPFAWQWMLTLNIARDGQSGWLVKHPPFTAFVVDPMTSTPLTSPDFRDYVIYAAQESWEQVPDQAKGPMSKFDVFCERFGIPIEARVFAKHSMLDGIVERASSGEFTLSQGLTLGGFDTDRSARQYARELIEYGVGW